MSKRSTITTLYVENFAKPKFFYDRTNNTFPGQYAKGGTNLYAEG
jgi:hypothetical protein